MSGCVVRVGMLSPGETQPGLSLLPGGQAGSGGDFPCASTARSSTNEPSNWQHGNILCSLSSGKRRVRKGWVRDPDSPAGFSGSVLQGCVLQCDSGDPGQGARRGSTLGWGAGGGKELKEQIPTFPSCSSLCWGQGQTRGAGGSWLLYADIWETPAFLPIPINPTD